MLAGAKPPFVRDNASSRVLNCFAEAPKRGNIVRLMNHDLRKRLTPEQYRVTQEAGTERAFTGEYWNHFEDGQYACVVCGEVLFDSGAKFESHCGWPSFTEPADRRVSAMALGKRATDENSKVEDRLDESHGMIRVEVVCRNCKAHLGHVFDDGPPPGGLRYCINSASLKFVRREKV